MRPPVAVTRLALAGALTATLAGCGSDPGSSSDRPAAASTPTVASLGTDPFVVRDELVEQVRASGGAHISVAGRASGTDVDLVFDAAAGHFARRFAWQQDGASFELMELSTGRVCANRAAGQALAGAGSTAMGYILASDKPYSCTTQRDNLEGFLIYGYAALDPVTRLAHLLGAVTMSDLGAETDADGTPTRHLQVRATESDRSLRSIATTYDLWVDADHRLVRAEFTSLDEGYGPYVATFDYDEPVPVTLPEASERGIFVQQRGSGVPGMGGYLLGQVCPDPTKPCDPTSQG